MNYEERDSFGMYKAGPDLRRGPGPQMMGADTLVGNDVYNHKGEDLGDVKEIMLDMRTGKVAYAVLSFGGFLGMGEKLFAVPWNALTLDTKNKRFVLTVEKERLKDAPGFDKAGHGRSVLGEADPLLLRDDAVRALRLGARVGERKARLAAPADAGRRVNARNDRDHLGRPVAAGAGLLLHDGRVHPRLAGSRGRCDADSCAPGPKAIRVSARLSNRR
jgi:sporulation protein YlmC with PRC-barrel domain